MDFCYFISNMQDVGRLVSFTPMRHGSKEWGVGFDQDLVKGQLAARSRAFLPRFCR